MSGRHWLVLEPRRLLQPTIDVYSAWITVGWSGLLMFQPDVYDTAPSFAALRALAPAAVWAPLLLLSALVQFVGIVVRKPPVRLLAQTSAAAWWTFCAVAFLAAGAPVKTGVVCYSTLSLLLLVQTLRRERA